MTSIVGEHINHAQGAMLNPLLSAELDAYAVDYWPAQAAAVGGSPGGAPTPHFPVAANPRSVAAEGVRSYLLDYYYRIQIRPTQLALGNLVTAQTRTVEVWNAWPATAQTLNSVAAVNADGIVATAPAAFPMAFAPLQSRLWMITVGTVGSPVIDATLSWLFAGLDAVDVTITGDRLVAWVLPPDWGNPITESLMWLTDVQEALDGSEYREPVRDTPRRQWEFDAIAQGTDRQQMEATLYDWRGRNWALPVWPDITWLGAPLAAGSSSIPVATAGLDFAVGSLAMLWSDMRTYELVEVTDVASDHIALANPTASDWPAQARLYPCRLSRLTDAPQLTRSTDRLTTTTVRFESVEPCTWPAIAPAATYLGIPVLETRPNESTSPTAAYDRQLVDIDGDPGLVYVDDITGIAWPTQADAWLVAGLAARSALRSLLYWQAGKAAALWVPSWSDDVTLAVPAVAASSTITVARIGITSHLKQQPGRRHLRIELYDGTILYRRVTGSSIVDSATELLSLDSALGVDIDAGQIRQINWLMLCRRASDTVQIAHLHDQAGLCTVSNTWAGVGAEEP